MHKISKGVKSCGTELLGGRSGFHLFRFPGSRSDRQSGNLKIWIAHCEYRGDNDRVLSHNSHLLGPVVQRLSVVSNGTVSGVPGGALLSDRISAPSNIRED